MQGPRRFTWARSAARGAAGQGLHQEVEVLDTRARDGGGVEDRRRRLPGVIVVDDKGNDFFAGITGSGGRAA